MKNAWIDPMGKLIEVGKFGHNDYANELLTEELGKNWRKDIREEEKTEYPYQVLHKRGWVRVKTIDYEPKIKILGDGIDLISPMRNTMLPAMNPAQLKTAQKLCAENGILFFKAINESKFW